MTTTNEDQRTFEAARWLVLVHGGAGDVPTEKRADHALGCAAAASVGAALLRVGGSALDAVEAAVRALEDDVRFNAGTGACLNEDGVVEHDASIMSGRDLAAGAVAALPGFDRPIAIARAAMRDGRHVMYAADGARRFAESHGFSRVDPSSLISDSARARWLEARAGKHEKGWAGGTVGAVALDLDGHVAAATSTGGMIDKRAGRVGDSAAIGAGTYADDEAGACSTTGHGESFLRTSFAARLVGAIGAREDVGQITLDKLVSMRARVGGTGGAIVVDRRGRAAWARTTTTMSWAIVRSGLDRRDSVDGEERAHGA